MMLVAERLVEIAKEFGGGFVAYFLHHMFHKVWRIPARIVLWLRKIR